MLPYEHTQPGTAMRVGMGAVILVLIVIQFATADAQSSVWLVVAGLAVLLYLHHGLTVRVDGEQVSVAFGPGLIKHTIPVSDILGVSVGRCAWYNGWGKRYTGAGWMFRVSGMWTVDVTRRDSSFRIGTDDPEGLLAAIQEAVARHGETQQDGAARGG